MILPDMLRNSPMFKRFDPKNNIQQQAIGIGRGGKQGVKQRR